MSAPGVVRVVVIVVGKPRNEALGAAAADYEQRAGKYWPLSVLEVKEEPAKGKTPDQVRDREAERIMERVPSGAVLVACAEGGTAMQSPAFAAWMQRARESGRDLAIAIGGAFGLGQKVLGASPMKL